ncbi:cytospin-B isoform X2 [Entelurus aequoreus]|uniref:cytospin-B isoform X2 n=1 Tax=Entelurus aequoreus TaxID=161455 RepID=UPI002B1DF431|nr:cytospin-B isoform X2 [Entelurus aequoreus]XP_061904180.1 cytospin-B isoform X2 [Entelurus aequoreus]
MMKTGATKSGLPKTGLPKTGLPKTGLPKAGLPKTGLPKVGHKDRAEQASSAFCSSSTTSTNMRTSRSSNTLASDQRLSRLKRANSDDTLTKPALGGAASGSRMKKTVTTGAIADLAEAGPRSLSSFQATKKSGIPTPREVPSSMTRDRISLRDQLKTSTSKRIVSSASTSSLSTLAKQTRSSTKWRGDAEGQERGLLECQVKELFAEAKAKDLMISNLRIELQRCQGKASTSPSSSPVSKSPQDLSTEHNENVAEALVLVGELREKNAKFQKELANLREENQVLKRRLMSFESSLLPSSPSKPQKNGLPSESNSFGQQLDHLSSPSLLKPSVSSTSFKDSPSPDSSGFEKIPSLEPLSSSVSDDATASRQDVSVQSLTEQIHKMEENHHSTAEELQATLHELTDQQQVVQELTAENERLVNEKLLLQTSLQQQRERLEVLAKKNEVLANRFQEQALAQSLREDKFNSEGPRLVELEQRYAELVESSRFEREKLVNIQQQLTSGLRALEKEHQEDQGQVHCFREEMDRMHTQLNRELEAKGHAAESAEEHKATADCLRLENIRLKAQLDIERQKIGQNLMVGDLKVMQSTSDCTELQDLLKIAHGERDQLKQEVRELRQDLLQAQAETEHAQATMSKMEAKGQQILERAEIREQEMSSRVSALEEAGIQAEKQVKEMKETIFELEDQVEQQRAVNLHTNQTVLDLENLVKKLEVQKADVEQKLKVFSKQMEEEKDEWRRFQADLQTAVVVANDIKVEAQQELRTVRRKLQEEQARSAKLSANMEVLQGVRSQGDDLKAVEFEGSRPWCSMIPSPPVDTNGDADTEPGATVKSLIQSFDTVEHRGPAVHTFQIQSSPRSPLSGIPLRTAPAAAVSPIQRQSHIKPLSKLLEKRITHGNFVHPLNILSSSGEDMKSNILMRKSPSLESIFKSPASLRNRTASFNCNQANSKFSVERQDPLASLAQEYGGSKRNALLKWCQKKTQDYPHIDLTNFSSSWSDGLAFCALLHTYLPAHIPYQELITQDKIRNLTLAFQAAESVGIKTSLNVEELMKTDRPDWQSVMQYVSQIYTYFET